MVKRQWRSVAVAALAMAVLASACGSSEDESSSSNTTSVPAATGAAFTGQTAAEATTLIDGLVGAIQQVEGNTTRGVTPDQITLAS